MANSRHRTRRSLRLSDDYVPAFGGASVCAVAPGAERRRRPVRTLPAPKWLCAAKRGSRRSNAVTVMFLRQPCSRYSSGDGGAVGRGRGQECGLVHAEGVHLLERLRVVNQWDAAVTHRGHDRAASPPYSVDRGTVCPSSPIGQQASCAPVRSTPPAAESPSTSQSTSASRTAARDSARPASFHSSVAKLLAARVPAVRVSSHGLPLLCSALAFLSLPAFDSGG